MKYILSGIIILAALAITPYLRNLAYLQRGYKAIGGEFAPLLLAVVLSIWMIEEFRDLELKYKFKQIEQERRNRDDEYGGKMY